MFLTRLDNNITETLAHFLPDLWLGVSVLYIYREREFTGILWSKHGYWPIKARVVHLLFYKTIPITLCWQKWRPMCWRQSTRCFAKALAVNGVNWHWNYWIIQRTILRACSRWKSVCSTKTVTGRRNIRADNENARIRKRGRRKRVRRRYEGDLVSQAKGVLRWTSRNLRI